MSRKMAAHEGGFLSLFTRQSGGQRVSPSQDIEDTQQFHFVFGLNLQTEKQKTGLGTWVRRLKRDFPDRLLAVSVSWKRCAVVWSFCVLVGHCAVCTLGAELNIAWLVLAHCCHAKPIHGACKRHTVQVSLHSLFS